VIQRAYITQWRAKYDVAEAAGRIDRELLALL
jgi:hypothetical protein